MEADESEIATEPSQASQETSITIRNVPTAVTRSSLVQLLNTLGFGADYNKVYLPIDRFRHRSKGFTVANFEKKQGAFQELQGLIKKQGAFQQDAVQEQMSALGNGSLHRSDLADEFYFIKVRA